MICLNCDTEFTPKNKSAKFCSDKCRVQYNRNNISVTKDHVTESSVTQNHVTQTDQLFEARYPGYYKFGDKVYERTCLICRKKFKTRLQLLKTCCPEHYIEVMDMLSGKYAKDNEN
jgi:hypothetical protein